MSLFSTYVDIATLFAASSAAESAKRTAMTLQSIEYGLAEKQKHNERQVLLRQIVFEIHKKFQNLLIGDSDSFYKLVELYFIGKEFACCGFSDVDFDNLEDKNFYNDLKVSINQCFSELCSSTPNEIKEEAEMYIMCLAEEDSINKKREELNSRISDEMKDQIKKDKYEKSLAELNELKINDKPVYEENKKRTFRVKIILILISALLIALPFMLKHLPGFMHVIVEVIKSPMYLSLTWEEFLRLVSPCIGVMLAITAILLKVPHSSSYEGNKSSLQKEIEENSSYVKINIVRLENDKKELEELENKMTRISEYILSKGADFKEYLRQMY